MKNFGKKISQNLTIGSGVFIFSIFILWIWNGLHINPELLIEDCYNNIFCTMENYSFYAIFISWFLLLIFLAVSCYTLLAHSSDFFETTNKNFSKLPEKIFLKKSLLLLSVMPIIITLIIIGLLIIDLTIIFSTFDLEKIYQNIQTKEFLIKLYAVGLGVIVFGVQLYVAYVRGMALKISQDQFNLTQIQKTNEEIDKRFQEGINLLGNDNESVRLGGIYVLWEIVKEAVKALPHLETKNDEVYPEKPEIIAHKKCHSLHTQILDILCAHIRTQTNSEGYLRQHYRSIYEALYPKQFKEYYGDNISSNERPHEKPSNEIQTLINLLTKSKSNDKNSIPNYALGFTLNFEKAILGGADCQGAHFEGANCSYGHLEGADCRYAHFEGANCSYGHLEGTDCRYAHFEGADCSSAHFEGANCSYGHLEGTDCSNTQFKGIECVYAYFRRAICRNTNFEGANCYSAYFEGAMILGTIFSANKIKYCTFDSINSCLGKLGKYELLDYNDASIILVDIKHEKSSRKESVTNENKVRLAEYCECSSLKMDTPWRISIHKVEQYVDLRINTCHTFYPCHNYTGQIKNHLAAFQTAYEAHNNDKDQFFASLSPENQKWARYYLNDFDAQDPEGANDQSSHTMEESQKTS